MVATGVSTSLTQREFAKRAGCSHTAIAKAVRRGRLVLDPDGRLDASLLDAWRKSPAPDPSARAPANGKRVTPPTALAAALLRREEAAASLRELELAQKAGGLISMQLAERTVFELARAWRDSWLNWPSRVAPLLATELGLEPGPVLALLAEHVAKQCAALGEPSTDWENNL